MKLAKDMAFMIALTSVCSIILFFLDHLTRFQSTKDLLIAEKTLCILDQKAEEDPLKQFKERFCELKVPGIAGKIFQHCKNEDIFLKFQEGPGMWGKIELIVVYDIGKKLLIGIEILKHNETPGIGSRITEASFSGQFCSMSVESTVKASKSRLRENEFDGVSGATVTSLAVEKIVNKAIFDMLKASLELKSSSQKTG